ncbi:MAG: AsmA-like C-terminal region-containing protein [Bryobacteraceae bacterium]
MRTSLRYGLAVLTLVLISGTIATYFYVQGLGPRVHDRVVRSLQERFNARVDLKSFHLSFFPHPNFVGEGLSICHKNWNDPYPEIYVHRFSASSDFSTLVGRKNNVDLVRLEGLRIHLPPRGRSARQRGIGDQPDIASAEPGHDTIRFRFIIQTIIADGAQLEIEPNIKGKLPLRFDIQRLTLHSVGPGQPTPFKVTLANGNPPGLIDSTGEFGPWQRDDPRSTPVSGNYTFQNADLSVFKGIVGTLSSDGSYHGVLQHIEVDGTTDTPNFALQRGGQAVHLITNFHAIVNGRDGDTILDPVDARFLRSEFICKGDVIHEPGANGGTVSLDAATKRARIDDIMRLFIKTKKPFLTGAVDVKTRIVIPPGSEDVLHKLKLNGKFGIASVESTDAKLTERIQTLSEAAQENTKKDEKESPETVVSKFRGPVKLADGIASFSHLSFTVPGALVKLTGTYSLPSGRIDMKGTFRRKATRLRSGMKHWLLKSFDPFFRKEGTGFVLPIKITGTREHPQFAALISNRERIIH